MVEVGFRGAEGKGGPRRLGVALRRTGRKTKESDCRRKNGERTIDA